MEGKIITNHSSARAVSLFSPFAGIATGCEGQAVQVSLPVLVSTGFWLIVLFWILVNHKNQFQVDCGFCNCVVPFHGSKKQAG